MAKKKSRGKKTIKAKQPTRKPLTRQSFTAAGADASDPEDNPTIPLPGKSRSRGGRPV